MKSLIVVLVIAAIGGYAYYTWPRSYIGYAPDGCNGVAVNYNDLVSTILLSSDTCKVDSECKINPEIYSYIVCDDGHLVSTYLVARSEDTCEKMLPKLQEEFQQELFSETE